MHYENKSIFRNASKDVVTWYNSYFSPKIHSDSILYLLSFTGKFSNPDYKKKTSISNVLKLFGIEYG